MHGAEKGRVEALLARLRLDPALLSRRPGAVSGGELQRLALARAMLARPRFLFADEPSSRLDPITQREVIGLLGEIVAADGLAVALVSHDQTLIARVSDRVCALAPPDGAADGVAEGAAPLQADARSA